MQRKISANINEKRKNELQAYICIILPIIGLFVFMLYPYIWSVIKSFYHYTGVPSETKFMGWQNYISSLTDKEYWNSWITTVQYALMKVPIELFLALVLAVVLRKNTKGSSIFRAIFYFPNLLSAVVVGLIFTNLFGYYGFINAWLIKFGVIATEIDWFANKWTAMILLVVGGIWNSIGINVIYFLSALVNVSEDVYEAAKLDGAGPVTTFFKITIPMIAPVFRTILLLSINGTLHVGEFVLTTTKGAPLNQTLTVEAYMTKKYLPGFAQATVDLGYGAAQSIITTIIFCIIAIVYSKLSDKMQDVY